MMHSRGGFVLSENQAFAGQTRTPGPSRLHASPTRKNMTTGKRAMGPSSKLFGQEGAANAKQLFQDSKSPVKALGDRNALKTPGPSRLAGGKPGASIRKDKNASASKQDSTSRTKKGGSEQSPRKATTSNALRSLNGKQRQLAADPKTPAPTQLNGKARTMSRQNSFITPAANVGRAGQIKARMGEMLDAEMGLSLNKADGAVAAVEEAPAVQMSEEEMYPEIEYMPPSVYAKHPVFEFPDELDDLPRAKQLGAQLASFTAMAFSEVGPGDVSDVELSPMQSIDGELTVARGAAAASDDDDDDDDPWPNVAVAVAVDAAPRKIAAKASAPSVGSTAAGVRSSVGGSARARPTMSGARSTTTLAKGAAQPARGLQRSIAPAANQSATRRPGVGGAAAKASSSSTGLSAARTKSAKVAAPASKMVLNPKLIDFVDDELGKQTEAALRKIDEDEDDLAALELDLGEA